jgi:undecaprenyl-phosphate 4-deoxy-4-formamido-L-arabinose transferase
MAILAGFERARGHVVVTLDADLQNPPEEIVRLLDKMDEGHDYVGSYRKVRQESRFHRAVSRAINRLRGRLTPVHMRDHGCMLRAYARSVVDVINHSREANTFVPALAYVYARRPAEIEVRHDSRAAGVSHYSPHQLMQLKFDLFTGFSVQPLQIFATVGITVSLGSVMLYVAVLLYHLFNSGPQAVLERVWDRDVLEFFLTGMVLFGLGVIGEYIVRVYEQVRVRPRYLVAKVLEKRD